MEESPGGRASVDVTVILPTYREAENLPILVPQVASALAAAGTTGEILVVDDDSPDNTPAVCERLAASCPLRLITRKNERGLSTAVLHGMRHARGKILLVMDADLSHPPEKIPELLRALKDGGADFAIGSRYSEGGGVHEKWSLLRRLNSRGATLLARPLTSVADPMSGFFAIRRSALDAAGELDPVGYKIGLELLVKCRVEKVVEVPIIFSPRHLGRSKLSLREQLRYLRHLGRLYEFKLGRAARPAKFLVVGATGMVVDLVSFVALLAVLDHTVARALAIWLAMTWNFRLNRRWTFKDARNGSVLAQYALFCLSCLLGALVNWGVSVKLISSLEFFSARKWMAALCGIVAGTGLNYLLCLKVVFHGVRGVRPDTSRTPTAAATASNERRER